MWDYYENRRCCQIIAIFLEQKLQGCRENCTDRIDSYDVYQILGLLRVELDSREKILEMASFLDAGYEDTQRILEELGYRKLYVRDAIDTIWMYTLMNHFSHEAVIGKLENF